MFGVGQELIQGWKCVVNGTEETVDGIITNIITIFIEGVAGRQALH